MAIPEHVLLLFSDSYANALRALQDSAAIEEIRCRMGQTISVCSDNEMRRINSPAVTAEELDRILERAANASLYAHGEEIRHGYLHTSGGCRVGLCGTVYQNGAAMGIRQITSISVRIAREIFGCSDAVFRMVCGDNVFSTLIISPPGGGKTTLLRDLIRQISNAGFRVSVADERGELAGAHDRMQGFDLGQNTDVLSGGRKQETSMMLLRAMSPQVLAFDEITAQEDLAMIQNAAGCGAALLATAHARDIASLNKRALYRELLDEGIFEKAIWIRQNGRKRRYVVEDLL